MENLVTGRKILAIDLSPLTSRELQFLLNEKIAFLPIFIRNLMQFRAHGIQEVCVQFRNEQDSLRRRFMRYRLLTGKISWFLCTKSRPTNREMIERMAEGGAFWLDPFYFINAALLHAFNQALESGRDEGVFRNDVSKNNLYWISQAFLRDFLSMENPNFAAHLRLCTPTEVPLRNPKAIGQSVKDWILAEKAERLLLESLADRPLGPLEWALHQPLCLALAHGLAARGVAPWTVTLSKWLLNFISSLLLLMAGQIQRYELMAVAALLWMLTDLLGHTDEDLARLTYQASPRDWKWYSWVEGGVLIFFLISGISVALESIHRNYVLFWTIVAGLQVATLAGAIGAFTKKHFQRISFSAYFREYWQRLPQKISGDKPWTRVIFTLRRFASRDVLVLAAGMAVLFGQPELIAYFTPVVVGGVQASLWYLHKNTRTELV